MLSIFPGGGLLDRAFELEGFCVVRGPDVIWGGDIRTFHPPAGRFDGIIGGDPCQSHSSLANLVRAQGLEPSFPDMTPDYQRVVEEARPAWFLRENTPQAPNIKPDGYDVRSFLLDHSHLDAGDGTGPEQMRRRRFWFGTRDRPCPELRAYIDFALFVLPDRVGVDCGHGAIPGQRDRLRTQVVTANARSVAVALGGSGKAKATAVGGHLRLSLEELLRLQGFQADYFGDHGAFRMDAMRKMVGNGVPLGMGRALAKAIRKAINP